MTNIPGLFAAGECDYQYHGANRLGANSLLSSYLRRHGGRPERDRIRPRVGKVGGGSAVHPVRAIPKKEEEKYEQILKMDGNENAYQLHKELGEWMTDNVTVVRYNDRLLKTDEKIQGADGAVQADQHERYRRWSNQAASFTRQLWNMLRVGPGHHPGRLLPQ